MGKRRQQELEGARIASVLIVTATAFMAISAPGYFAGIIEQNPLLLIGLAPVWLLILATFALGWYTLVRAVLRATRGRRGLARFRLFLGLER